MHRYFLQLVFFIIFTCHATAGVTTTLLADDFQEPLWIGAPSGDLEHLWVLEKKGKIILLHRESGTKKTFLDISDRIKIRMNEQGLLGLAFAPDYQASGRFYLNYTNQNGDTEIVRFTAHGEKKIECTPSTSELLLEIEQDARNHNGGWLGFGPDGFLYIATGDGGASYDPKNRAQDLSSHLGKLLRIDVSGDKGYQTPPSNPFLKTPHAQPEIYAYGLRNPWRCYWHHGSDSLYIADVGQNKVEEVNFIPADQLKGANFGWKLREAHMGTRHRKDNALVGGERPTGAIDPIYYYKHGTRKFQGVSVTGGIVYTGPIEELQGAYFFADYANPRVWSLKVVNGKATELTDWTEQLGIQDKKIYNIASFGEDHLGNLLIVSHQGAIYQLIEN